MAKQAEAIVRRDGLLVVPARPIIPFIEGDGTGPDIWRASVRVFDAAVNKAYNGERAIEWLEVLAGEKSFKQTGNWLPDATLDLTGPGTESGTYDSFIEIALSGIAEERGQADDATRTDYAASADDNVIVQNIEASDSSLGWVGFAFAEEAGDQIKEIPISAEPGGDCVEPSTDTIADQSYPLSRSLYIYVNTAKADENPAVAAYVDLYLSDLAGFVEDSGYVALPDDIAAETTSAWDGR